MGYVARLRRGGRTLDLASGRYSVGDDFVPPTVSEEIYTASGSSANALGGGERVGLRAGNRIWSFSLHILGDTIKEVRRAAHDLSAFLAWAGDDSYPVYFEFNESDAVPTPIWGQDGTLRYEIVHGRLDFAGDGRYSVSASGAQGVPFNVVTLTIKPYALGLPQTAAQAMGGVFHDIAGAASGIDRGVAVPYNSGNAFTNPIFANPTWSAGWTEGANLDAYLNTNPEFVLHGIRSAKLQATGATRTFYSSLTLTVSTYTLSFYAKRADGAAVDASTCVAHFNNANQTSSYLSVGDGWYRVSYTGAASASSASYGVGLAAGQTVYVSGFQVENLGFATPLKYGDLYGCAWAGTAHASATTQTAGYLRVPLDENNYNVGHGCIRSVVTFPTLGFGSNPVVFYESAGGLRIFYNIATSRFVFSDNVNSVTGGSALVAGETVVLHACWSSGRLQLYVNGVSIGVGGTYTPATTAPAYMYVGTSPTPANHQNHVFRDFAIFSDALTTEQVAADYARIAPIVADGQRVSSIPYLWTKDGDNGIDNYNDSTRDNWGVYQGVPGTAPAKVEYYLTGPGSDGGGGSSVAHIALWITDEFCDPARILYSEQSGTADGNASGGAFRRTAATSTEAPATVHTLPWATDSALYRFVEGREWFAIVRGRVNSSSIYGRQVIETGGAIAYGGYAYPGGPGVFENALLPSVVFPKAYAGRLRLDSFEHYISVYSLAPANLDIDFVSLFPRPLATVKVGSRTIISGTRWACDYGAGISVEPGRTVYGSTGDELALEPNKYNVVLSSNVRQLDYTVEDNGPWGSIFAETTITPRYHLV